MIMMMINNAILQKHRQGRHIPKISSIGVKIAEIRGGSTWKTSKFPRPFILSDLVFMWRKSCKVLQEAVKTCQAGGCSTMEGFTKFQSN